MVPATKVTMARDPGDPNSGRNHRLNIVRLVEQSLRQLGTDRIDLLYLHGWDFTTRPNEVMRGLDDLVSVGQKRPTSASATCPCGAWPNCKRSPTFAAVPLEVELSGARFAVRPGLDGPARGGGDRQRGRPP